MALFKVSVSPNSKKNIVKKINEQSYEVWLKAKPERNQANQLLILALAEYFNIQPTAIKIISGHHSVHKRVDINRL